MHNPSVVHFRLFFYCFTSILHVAMNLLQEMTVFQCFIHCFALRFVIKIEILPMDNHRFLLQMKCKAVDKTLEEHILIVKAVGLFVLA